VQALSPAPGQASCSVPRRKRHFPRHGVVSTGEPADFARDGSQAHVGQRTHDGDRSSRRLGVHAWDEPTGVIVHSDLKPGNCMVAEGFQVKIADLGYAQLAHPSKGPLEARGGTLVYMAPETLTKQKRVSVQSDVYALGLVVWAILARKEPFVGTHGNDEAAIIKAVHAGEGDAPPDWCPEMILDLLARCGERSGAKRPTSEECLRILQSAEGTLDKVVVHEVRLGCRIC